MKRKYSDEEMQAALARNGFAREKTALELGLSIRNLMVHLARWKAQGYEIPESPYRKKVEGRLISKPEYEIETPPEDDIPIDDLVEMRKRQFAAKRDHEEAAKLIPVKIKMKGAIGLLHFGDPHVDDDGTDIAALEEHTRLVRETEGMFACNVGDTINNWCGRLARLYGEQATSAAQAWRLAEWFVGRCDWLYMIGGNHDLWSGAGDPLKWIAKQQNSMYKASEARISLNFPNGLSVRVNARHDHSGSSIWNPAHGPMKAALMGTRDHIYVAGHKHESAYSVLKDAISGITMHALKVSSYKIYDRFAKERGFRDNTLSPCAVTVINPDLPETHPDLIKVFWEPSEAVKYLNYLRKK
jgi:hypothetical protein